MVPPRLARPPKAVLCDLDGTLVDSRVGIVDAFLTAFAAEGLPAPPVPAIEATIGWPLPDAFVGLGASRDLVETLRLHYRARYDVVCVSGSALMPGVAEALARMRAAGARLAVVTTKRGKYPPIMLAGHGVGHHFDVVVGADDVQNLKPHPEPVLVACERLGLRPEEVAMVGDTPFDVGAGRAAGAFAVGVLGGHADREALEQAGADVVVATFADVPRVLGF